MGGQPHLTAADWARPEVLFAFLDGLRDDLGFNLGTGHYSAAQDLLLALVAKPSIATDAGRPSPGQAGEPDASDRLARLLGPLLCSTPREQEDFPRLFARWSAGPARTVLASLAATDISEAVTAPPSARLAAHRPPDESKVQPLARAIKRIERAARTWWWIPVAMTLLASGMGTAYYLQAHLTSRELVRDFEAFFLPRPPLAPRPPDLALAWWLAAVGVIAGAYLCWRVWLSLIGRQFLVRRTTAGVPALERLPVRAASDQLFEPRSLKRSAEQLRRRVPRPGRNLDVEATIEQTARHGGWPTLVAGRRLVRPEYLVLIERARPGDQQSRLFDELTERLAKQGVVLERAYFDGDPRTCFQVPRAVAGRGSPAALATAGASAPHGEAEATADPETASTPDLSGAADAAKPLSLRELYSLYPEHRLLLASDCEGLFSSVTGEEAPWVEQLLAWESRAVLSPRPVGQWGRRERDLARRFAVVPATLAGWAELATILEGRQAPAPRAQTTTRSFGRWLPAGGEEEPWAPLPEELRVRPARWLDRNPPAPSKVQEVLDGLEQSLGDAGFYWLAACAVYPALDWEMTVALGHMLKTENGGPLYNERRLTSLLALPWLRRGTMPDWLRQSLLARLPRRREAQVRASLEALLLTALQGDDPRASGAFALQIADRHRRALDRLWGALWRRLARREDDEGPARDYVFRDFMAGRHHRLAVALPNRVGRLLRRRHLDGVQADVVAPLALLRAQRIKRWLLAGMAVWMSFSFVRRAGWVIPAFVPAFVVIPVNPSVSCVGLFVLGYVWRTPRLMLAGFYWSIGLPFVALVPLSVPLSGALTATVFAAGLALNQWSNPIVLVDRSMRLERIRHVLLLACATYLTMATLIISWWTSPPPFTLDSNLQFDLALAIASSLAVMLLSVAYSERSVLLALAGVPLVPFCLLPEAWETSVKVFIEVLLLIGVAATVNAWRRLRPSILEVPPSDAPGTSLVTQYEEAPSGHRRVPESNEEVDRADMASAYLQRGTAAQDRGELDQALSWYREALNINEDLGNRAGVASSYHHLGMVTQDRGDLDQALSWYRKALEINEEFGNRAAMASSYHHLGMVAQDRGDLDQAVSWYRKALEINEELGNRAAMASSYHHLGMVAQDRGDLDQALSRYREALGINEELGNRARIASSYHQLGNLAHWRADYDQALSWYQKALKINEVLGNRAGMASSYSQLGRVAQDRGEYDQALSWYRKALEINDQLGNRAGMASSYHDLGRVAQDRGDYDEALSWYRRSLEISEELGNRAGMAITISQMGILLTEAGSLEEAVPLQLRSLTFRIETGSPDVRIDLHWLARQRESLSKERFQALLREHAGDQGSETVLQLLDQVPKWEPSLQEPPTTGEARGAGGRGRQGPSPGAPTKIL